VDPNIPDGEVPKVEHVVLLPGIAIAPVTVGAGLTPGDAISVAPRGMPVGDTVEPVPKPSGEVASIVGVGAAMPLTCAMAPLQTKSAGRTAAISENLIGILRLKTAPPRRTPASIGFEMISLDARLSDIGQSPSGGSCRIEKISSGRCPSSLSSVSLRPALNISDKSHGREVGWLAPPVQLNTSLCFLTPINRA
jgi:hypothetical protein